MNINRDTAQQVESIMRDVGAQIDNSVRVVMDNCDEATFHHYRRIAGKLMGEILIEILNPIYAAHPDLTPPGLRQDGKDHNA
jgi:hypothetical protein